MAEAEKGVHNEYVGRRIRKKDQADRRRDQKEDRGLRSITQGDLSNRDVSYDNSQRSKGQLYEKS